MGISINRAREGLVRMKLWGKNKERLKIKKIAAARSVYQGLDTTRTTVEVKMRTEDGEKLELEMELTTARQLIRDLTIAYTAAVEPLHTGQYESQWQGMDDNS